MMTHIQFWVMVVQAKIRQHRTSKVRPAKGVNCPGPGADDGYATCGELLTVQDLEKLVLADALVRHPNGWNG